MFRKARQNLTNTSLRREQDEQSIVSTSSFSRYNYSTLARSFTRQASSNTFNITQSESIPLDGQSISSKRSGRSAMYRSDAIPRHYRTQRIPEEPPSSYKPLASMKSWTDEEIGLRTAKEILAEINALEAERRRIQFAFETMEDSALTQNWNHPQDVRRNTGILMSGSRSIRVAQQYGKSSPLPFPIRLLISLSR